MSNDEKIRSIEDRLTALERERGKLFQELAILRSQRDQQKSVTPLGAPARSQPSETNDEKADLFLALFRGRESVYPKRWENTKTGKSG